MAIELRPPFHDLTYLTPLSDARAGTLVDFLARGQPELVVDFGCGWAELLLQTLEASPSARGVGIDSDERSISHASGSAERRGIADRVEFVVGDARAVGPTETDAAICIASSQIWGPPVEDAQPLDYHSALAALRSVLPRGGRLVFGDAIWSKEPTPAAAAPLSGRLDEFVMLPELVELCVEHGFMPVSVHEASPDEWDEFESGFSACYGHWLAEHEPDDPDAEEVRARAARQRSGYLSGYRGVLGLAYLALLAV